MPSSLVVFVPSDYDAESKWPLVLVMDPRGKALVPLERMAGAAEELGFIVLSSYNTAIDSVAEPNERAIAAMMEDAQDLFSIDTRRLYFAGHSGTARHAWLFAERFAANAAGVIGFGAGHPNAAQVVTMTSGGSAAFAFFGGAGETD